METKKGHIGLFSYCCNSKYLLWNLCKGAELFPSQARVRSHMNNLKGLNNFYQCSFSRHCFLFSGTRNLQTAIAVHLGWIDFGPLSNFELGSCWLCYG